jgi:hypothetical protein
VTDWPPEAFDEGWSANLAGDMWAVGVILFVVLAGCHPFDQGGDADDDTICEAIYEAAPSFKAKVWKQISPDAVSFCPRSTQ